jgi:CheY-like chemotaxis protein
MENILYIEPSKLFQVMLEDLLYKYGCNFIKVSSGYEAIEAIKDQEIDYIFTASILEDMHLEEFVEILKENNLNEYPIILISSIEEIKEIKDFFKMGITDFILKGDLGKVEITKSLLNILGLNN